MNDEEFDPELLMLGLQQDFDFTYGRGQINVTGLDVQTHAHGGLASDPDYIGAEFSATSQDHPDEYSLTRDMHKEPATVLQLIGAAIAFWR